MCKMSLKPLFLSFVVCLPFLRIVCFPSLIFASLLNEQADSIRSRLSAQYFLGLRRSCNFFRKNFKEHGNWKLLLLYFEVLFQEFGSLLLWFPHKISALHGVKFKKGNIEIKTENFEIKYNKQTYSYAHIQIHIHVYPCMLTHTCELNVLAMLQKQMISSYLKTQQH